MSLAHLSLQRVPMGKTPKRPPTNTERMQAYRARLPVTFGNNRPLPPTRFQAAL